MPSISSRSFFRAPYIRFPTALVEIFNSGVIDERSKQKDDEKDLSQKEIWKNKYA